MLHEELRDLAPARSGRMQDTHVSRGVDIRRLAHVGAIREQGLQVFQAMAMIGVSFVFCSVGVYFRDIKDFVQVFCVMGMYLMPIFFLPTMVPWMFRPFLYLNPFSYMIWCYQDVCYFGRFEHPWAWGAFVLMSFGIFYLGYRVFRKLKIMFGNVRFSTFVQHGKI